MTNLTLRRCQHRFRDRTQSFSDLGSERCVVGVEHALLRMYDDIGCQVSRHQLRGQRSAFFAQKFPGAAFDAVTAHCIAEHTAHSESEADIARTKDMRCASTRRS